MVIATLGEGQLCDSMGDMFLVLVCHDLICPIQEKIRVYTYMYISIIVGSIGRGSIQKLH